MTPTPSLFEGAIRALPRTMTVGEALDLIDHAREAGRRLGEAVEERKVVPDEGKAPATAGQQSTPERGTTSLSSESSHAEPWRIERARRAATNTAEPDRGPKVDE